MQIIDTIYSIAFAELNDTQKKQAIEIMRDIENQDSNPYWANDLIEQTKEDLKEYGINEADIQYSGFCSQGDGASISTKNIEAEKFLRKVKSWSKFKSLHKFIINDTISLSVIRYNYQYSHEYCVYGCVEFPYYVEYSITNQAQVEELQTLITETIRDLSRKLYKELEDENDYHYSEEAIIENINANDYHFKVNSTGKVLSLA